MDTDQAMTITPRARQTLSNMYDEAMEYESNDSIESLNRCIWQMIGLGGRVTSDGELDLICSNDFITYGLRSS